MQQSVEREEAVKEVQQGEHEEVVREVAVGHTVLRRMSDNTVAVAVTPMSSGDITHKRLNPKTHPENDENGHLPTQLVGARVSKIAPAKRVADGE